MKSRPKTQQVNNLKKPSATIKTQEAQGSEIYTSSGLKWVFPAINTKLIEQYSENALLAEPLKNIKDLIFTTYEDHPSPWVTVKDPDGNIDDNLSKEGQTIAKVCDFYNAHIRVLMDQELGGCSVWSPGWGAIEGVTGVCPNELRNLPWNSFRELPRGFMDIYNDIMPGIVIDKTTKQVRVFQKEDDRTAPKEIQDTLIVQDPTAPKPAGKPGCLPVVALITNSNYADKAWNQKMNRVAAPSIFPYVEKITANNKAYVEAIGKKWGKDTCFIMTDGMDFRDPHLVESSTAEERLIWLKKRIDGFYNPSTFLQKDGNTIGGADTGALRLVNNMIASTLARIENGLGEKILQKWLDDNGFAGYTAEVRFPRPETTDDTQVLAEITEANKNGQISRAEARQKYPNLDLPELTPEEEAKMDAEFTARKPAPVQFGFGGQQDQQQPQDKTGVPVGNLQQMPVSQTERELLAATRQCAEDVKRIVREKVNPQNPGFMQTIKNVLMSVNNEGDYTGDGQWITINGAHIFLRDGETPAEGFKRVTGKDLPSGHDDKTNVLTTDRRGQGGKGDWYSINDADVKTNVGETPQDAFKRVTGEDFYFKGSTKGKYRVYTRSPSDVKTYLYNEWRHKQGTAPKFDQRNPADYDNGKRSV